MAKTNNEDRVVSPEISGNFRTHNPILQRRRASNPNKLAYKLAGWPAQLTASAFNQLGQYANSPGQGIFPEFFRNFSGKIPGILLFRKSYNPK